MTAPNRSARSDAKTKGTVAQALPDTDDRYPTRSRTPSAANPRSCPTVATIDRVPPPEKQTAVRGKGARSTPSRCSGARPESSSVQTRARTTDGKGMAQ
ncbi:MAG TPA: hypothetical protein EYQ83_18015 [Acidobacteria bacterium]|nr:hypothetical protein [Acidobacteriota bacterium]